MVGVHAAASPGRVVGQVRCETYPRQRMIFMGRSADRHYETRRTYTFDPTVFSLIIIRVKISRLRFIIVIANRLPISEPWVMQLNFFIRSRLTLPPVAVGCVMIKLHFYSVLFLHRIRIIKMQRLTFKLQLPVGSIIFSIILKQWWLF